MENPFFCQMLHGGDYNPEQWLHSPEILEKDIEYFKKAKINEVSLGIFSWAVLEPVEGEFHFEWMEKTLDDLKNTMPKAFNGALKNGGQMRALVSELILNAVRDNKIDEAKTAMEVLSVVKYGYTTSKIMDTLRADKDLFTIFSDKDLSWNKGGVEIVTNAMDKTIRFAFLTAGYAITGIGNAIRLNGSKFNGKTGRMKVQLHFLLSDNFCRISAILSGYTSFSFSSYYFRLLKSVSGNWLTSPDADGIISLYRNVDRGRIFYK